MATKFRGSIVALVTPMRADGDIDWQALASLVNWHLEAGTDGIVAVGTTGESPTLTMTEHQKVIAKIIELVAGKIPVIAGTGSNSTAEARELTAQACADGADACLSVVPYYNKPTQQGMLRHFSVVADASNKPVLLYNVPSRTVADLHNDTVVQLAEHPLIGGIKDATGDISRLRDLKQRIGREFSWLSGDDATACDYAAAGGDGIISVTANIAPRMMHDMIGHAVAGERDQAAEIAARLEEFSRVQGIEANPIPVKWALADAGRIKPGIRLPLLSLSFAHHDQVRAAVENLH